MKQNVITILTAGFLAIASSTFAFADSPRPGHNNTAMFQQIDKSGSGLQATNAEGLSNLSPAAGGKFSWKTCQKDISTFCSGAKENAAISSCLEKHHSSLSGKCDQTTNAYEKFAANQSTKK